VLENHHLFKAFTIMRKDQCNFLKDMNYSQKQEFRHIVIEIVLATDFSVHLRLTNQFKTMVSTLTDRSNIESAEDKLLLWRIVMKCADLGHCSKPVALHKKWAMRVMEEMYRQGDAEKRMGFSISAAMDRDKIDMAAKSQAGFLEFVCLPLFQAWELFSRDSATVKRVESNIAFWRECDESGTFGG
jgi:cAMP-specific phosphodiesterase 4